MSFVAGANNLQERCGILCRLKEPKAGLFSEGGESSYYIEPILDMFVLDSTYRGLPELHPNASRPLTD